MGRFVSVLEELTPFIQQHPLQAQVPAEIAAITPWDSAFGDAIGPVRRRAGSGYFGS